MNYRFLTGILLLIVLMMGSVSCSHRMSANKIKKETIVYPLPPDAARIQYLLSISSSDNVTGKRKGFSKFVLGESVARLIKKPYGVSVRNGKVFICDSGIKGLEVIDLDKGTFDYFIPKGNGELKTPINCCAAADGNLYVADPSRKQIIIFDRNLDYLASFGDRSNFKATDVVVYKDKIWVSNLETHQINVFETGTYKPLFSFPDTTEAKGDSHLFSPTNICIHNDTVYVSDMGDTKVKLFSADGEFLSSVGSLGTNLGNFVRPKGIAVDRESNLYVVDASIENTQIFNRDGSLLLFFGKPYDGNPGDMWLPAKVFIDYDNLRYFRKYVDPAYDLKYIILVTNQYGPDKVNIYGRIEPKVPKPK